MTTIPLPLPSLTVLSGTYDPDLPRRILAQDEWMCEVSVIEPARMALIAMFFPMQIGADLRDPKLLSAPLPYEQDMTPNVWISRFHKWMTDTDQFIFARIAASLIDQQKVMFERFLVVDANEEEGDFLLKNVKGLRPNTKRHLHIPPALTFEKQLDFVTRFANED